MVIASIIIYSSLTCPYCDHAKHLLDAKGIKYSEINVDKDPVKLKEMVEKTGESTVPQIFIDGKYIGGFQDLKQLNESGTLDVILRK